MSEQSAQGPSAAPLMPPFLVWAGPILSLWALAVAWFASLYSLTGERPSLLQPETFFEPNASPSDRAVSAMPYGLFAMPVVSAVYLTTFFCGLHIQRKKSTVSKIANTAFCFFMSRIFEIATIFAYLFVSTMIYAFVFLSASSSLPRQSDFILLVRQILPISLGVFFSSGITWIVHRLAFDRDPYNSADWFTAHLFGYAGGVGLLIAIVVGVASVPDPRVMYVAMTALLLLPLPHLLVCYRVTRKLFAAGRIPAENIGHADGLVLHAGLFAVAGFIAAVMISG